MQNNRIFQPTTRVVIEASRRREVEPVTEIHWVDGDEPGHAAGDARHLLPQPVGARLRRQLRARGCVVRRGEGGWRDVPGGAGAGAARLRLRGPLPGAGHGGARLGVGGGAAARRRHHRAGGGHGPARDAPRRALQREGLPAERPRAAAAPEAGAGGRRQLQGGAVVRGLGGAARRAPRALPPACLRRRRGRADARAHRRRGDRLY